MPMTSAHYKSALCADDGRTAAQCECGQWWAGRRVTMTHCSPCSAISISRRPNAAWSMLRTQKSLKPLEFFCSTQTTTSQLQFSLCTNSPANIHGRERAGALRRRHVTSRREQLTHLLVDKPNDTLEQQPNKLMVHTHLLAEPIARIRVILVR